MDSPCPLHRPVRIMLAGFLLVVFAVPATAGSLFEDFTSTTNKDASNTSADWHTAGGGSLRLFPYEPALLGHYDTPDQALEVAVSGTVAYVADRISGLQIIDISNPASPTLV